ncbi:hypothetical protein [Streptomyces sp. NPDC054765]
MTAYTRCDCGSTLNLRDVEIDSATGPAHVVRPDDELLSVAAQCQHSEPKEQPIIIRPKPKKG